MTGNHWETKAKELQQEAAISSLNDLEDLQQETLSSGFRDMPSAEFQTVVRLVRQSVQTATRN